MFTRNNEAPFIATGPPPVLLELVQPCAGDVTNLEAFTCLEKCPARWQTIP